MMQFNRCKANRKINLIYTLGVFFRFYPTYWYRYFVRTIYYVIQEGLPSESFHLPSISFTFFFTFVRVVLIPPFYSYCFCSTLLHYFSFIFLIQITYRKLSILFLRPTLII
jgi:hypothetical protein